MTFQPQQCIHAFERAGEAFILTTPQGIITYASPGVEEVTGYTATELVDQHTTVFKSYLTPRHVYVDMWSTILGGEVWKGTIENRRKNRDVYREDLTIVPILDEDRHIQSFFALKKDVSGPSADTSGSESEKKWMIHEGSHLEELVDSMSKEFRTTFHTINGFSQLLYEELYSSLSEAQHEFFNIILQGNQRLIRMVEDVSLATQIEVGHQIFAFEATDASLALKKTVATLLALVDTDNVRVIRVIPDRPLMISVDPQQFDVIISHLLINAIKFTPVGTITIGIEARDGQAMISVIDTGIGMSERFQPYAFHPFKQEELGYNRELEGFGLGLTIAERLTTLMHGSISFTSSKNEGTTFVVSFPLLPS